MDNIPILPIPPFLNDFLFFGSLGELSDIKDFSYMLNFSNEKNIPATFQGQKELFLKIYEYSKTALDLRWNVKHSCKVDPFFDYPINNEKELLSIPLKSPDYISFNILLDIPMFWYDHKIELLGKSIMPGGIRITFSNYPRFVMFIHIEFLLFTNHLQCRDNSSPISKEYLFFEPAAVLNRKIFREFAMGLEKYFPQIDSFFHSEESTVPQFDKYGFPDNAEEFYFNRE